MSDGESTRPAPRKRPSYGLPAPTSPSPTGDGTPGQWSPSFGEQPGAAASSGPFGDGSSSGGRPDQGQYGASPHIGAPSGGSPYADSPYGGAPSSPPPGPGYGGADLPPQTGPLPASGHTGPPQRRRRGMLPLIIGLVLLVIIGPLMTIGGIVWGLSSLVPDATSGPTVIEGGSVELEVPANEMLIIYVPAEDAETAQCTAEGSGSGDVSTVPGSSPTTFGDGSEYVQVLGAATLQDTTVTISCTGTESPAYLGPYSLFGMAAPLLIGPIIGVVAGLIGLVLTIVGIVLLVRSRRV